MAVPIGLLRLALDRTADQWKEIIELEGIPEREFSWALRLFVIRIDWDLLGTKIDVLAGRPWERATGSAC